MATPVIAIIEQIGNVKRISPKPSDPFNNLITEKNTILKKINIPK
jgi:hypothetical protein